VPSRAVGSGPAITHHGVAQTCQLTAGGSSLLLQSHWLIEGVPFRLCESALACGVQGGRGRRAYHDEHSSPLPDHGRTACPLAAGNVPLVRASFPVLTTQPRCVIARPDPLALNRTRSLSIQRPTTVPRSAFEISCARDCSLRSRIVESLPSRVRSGGRNRSWRGKDSATDDVVDIVACGVKSQAACRAVA